MFPDSLEHIGVKCFSESGLEKVTLPKSTRTVAVRAFKGCEQLRHVELNEGLEVLGGKWMHERKEF